MPRQRVNVIQDEETPVPKDILAAEICKLSDATNKLILSGLNQKAVVILLRDATGLSKRDINAVLDGLGQLRAEYTHD